MRQLLLVARRLLLAQARQRGLAVEQRSERRPVGVDVQQHRVFERRLAGPGVVQRRKAVGVVGVHGRAALDQRAFAAQLGVDVGLRPDALDVAVGFLVPLAQGQRPGGRQQQAWPAVDLGCRQPLQPLEHRALATARHQRVVQAALGQVVGGFALAGGQRVLRRRFEQPERGQTIGCTRIQRGLLGARQLREAAPQLVACE